MLKPTNNNKSFFKKQNKNMTWHKLEDINNGLMNKIDLEGKNEDGVQLETTARTLK